MKISIIGSGGFGTAMAIHLAKLGNEVLLWSWCKEESDTLKAEKENKQFLPGVKIPDSVLYTYSLDEAVNFSDYIITVLPSHKVLHYSKELEGKLSGKVVFNLTKGIDNDTLMTMSECLLKYNEGIRLCVISGPSHAEELAREIPTALVAASYDENVAKEAQDIFSSNTVRVYTSTDVKGVEIGGALKNVIALCAGMIDGLGYGDNTKAALLTRGIREIMRLGVALGANGETLFGLTGIGDLIVTATSMHSRNRRAGILLGQGKSLDETLAEIKMVTEGITTCTAAYKLSQKLGVEMPIVEKAYQVLYEGKDPREAVLELMTREKKGE